MTTLSKRVSVPFKKIALALTVAAVLFAGGSAMANDRYSQPKPKKNPYFQYGELQTMELLDHINRDHPVRTPNHYQ